MYGVILICVFETFFRSPFDFFVRLIPPPPKKVLRSILTSALISLYLISNIVKRLLLPVQKKCRLFLIIFPACDDQNCLKKIDFKINSAMKKSIHRTPRVCLPLRATCRLPLLSWGDRTSERSFPFARTVDDRTEGAVAGEAVDDRAIHPMEGPDCVA